MGSVHFWKNDAADASTKNQKKITKNYDKIVILVAWYGLPVAFFATVLTTTQRRKAGGKIVTGYLGHLWYPTFVSQYKPEDITWQ